MTKRVERGASEAPGLFPLFLKLTGRRCLVVGAGAIAESKIESLLRAGARVKVVAPEATEKVQGWARAKQIVWRERAYRTADMGGSFMVIAATSSSKLHRAIFRQARRDGILCNAVDDPPNCDFYYPAVVRRGSLQIAISTGGESPSLAARLRAELERQFGPEYGPWVKRLGRERAGILRRVLDPAMKRNVLHRQSSAAEFRAFRRGKSTPVRSKQAHPPNR
ncbi:MAG: bifunctional precorrin-2 dehydrogenase/sirohydrochlorin ferrochelatase [Candidatus Acidiferrales bacterium]